MNVENFNGRPDQLAARLVALLAGAATTIDNVIVGQKSNYVIIWS